MKTRLVTPLIILLLVCSCTSSKEKADQTEQKSSTAQTSKDPAQPFTSSSDVSGLTKVSGMLNYSGNEPFAVPTIFVSDSVAYRLEADEEFLKEKYSSLNGNYASLYGELIKRSSMQFFEVHFYEIKEVQK